MSTSTSTSVPTSAAVGSKTNAVATEPRSSSSSSNMPPVCEALPNGKRKWRVTVLISGSGSNLAALMAALPTTLSECCITSVFSNSKDAFGLERAAKHSPQPIPNHSFSPYNHQKLHPELYNALEKKLKSLLERIKTLKEQERQQEDRGLAEELNKVEKEWKDLKKTLAASIKPRYQIELAERVRSTRPDLIVLAGFMLILLPETLETLRRDWDEQDSTEDVADSELKGSQESRRFKIESTVTKGKTPYSDPTGLRGKPIPIINLHPALPGSFIGPHVIEDAWEAFNQRQLPAKDGDQPGPVWEPRNGDEKEEQSPFGDKIDKTGIMIHRVIPELDRGEPVLWKEVEMKQGEALAELKERIHKVEHLAIVEAVKKVTELLQGGDWWKESAEESIEQRIGGGTVGSTA